MIYHKIDKETGMFAEDAILNEPPMVLSWPVTDEGTPIQPEVPAGESIPPMYIPDPAYIAVPCPEGLYWPRWDGGKWVEGGVAPPNPPEPAEPTLEERTAALETATQQQAATLDEVVTILEAIV